MSPRKSKAGFFALEALNSFATAFYFNYLFFYLQKHFGFGNLGNLTFSALNGFVYIFSSLYGGRFAQKHGYFSALYLGFGGMAAALLAGLFAATRQQELLVLLTWTVAVCFTWPTLEALVTEGEDAARLPRMVGIYNMVWASMAALAFFSGGAIVQLVGWKSVFWLPAGLHLTQLALALHLSKWHNTTISAPPGGKSQLQDEPEIVQNAASATGLVRTEVHHPILVAKQMLDPAESAPPPRSRPVAAQMFLRMAWAANPLWRWSGWHYRLRWLIASYLLLIISFAGLVLSPYLWTVLLAELVFGWSVGLIYYSSLFYSMDTSDTKGVHGGVHEAAIGLGICTGPALGACALGFFPQQTHASAWAVSALLVFGLVVLGKLKRSI